MLKSLIYSRYIVYIRFIVAHEIWVVLTVSLLFRPLNCHIVKGFVFYWVQYGYKKRANMSYVLRKIDRLPVLLSSKVKNLKQLSSGKSF